MRRLITTLLIALAAALVLGGAQSGAVTKDSGVTSFAATDPGDITAGPDGAIWIAEGDDSYGDGIGRMATDGNSYVHYELPNSKPTPIDHPTRTPTSITAGPDGALWFTEYGQAGSNWAGVYGDRIGRITTGGAITEYTLPVDHRAAHSITNGPDGALWFAMFTLDSSRTDIGRITTAGAITTFTLPAGTQIGDMSSGPDGAVWFTDYPGNRIGRITTGGTVSWYPLPHGGGPAGITRGPDGALWFTETDGHRIGRISTSGDISEFALDAQDHPASITIGPDDALWFTGASVPPWGESGIGRIASGGDVSKYSIAGGMLSASAITLGPDNALWIASPRFYSVYRVDPAELTAPTSPTNVSAPVVPPAAQVGVPLTTSDGVWQRTPTISFDYQWQRCEGYAVSVIPDNPAAYWRLDDTGGSTAADSSGNNRPGSYQNGVQLGAFGPTGFVKAAGFDGLDDRVDVPALGITSGPFTLEAWAYLRSDGRTGADWHTVMGYDNTHRILWSGSDGSLLAQFDGNFYATAKAVRDQWHHIVYTFDGTTERFYLDGQPAGSHATTKPIWASAFSLGSYNGSDYMFNGYLGEVAVYKSALSPARVQAHYSGIGLNGCSPIDGATHADYTPTVDDFGRTLAAVVTASNGAGQAIVWSNQTRPVTLGAGGGGAPTNVSAPSVPAAAQVGVQLNGSAGLWAGTQPIGYGFQWQRVASYPVAVLPDSPVAYWRLDEPGGTTATDASGNGKDGVYANGVVLGAAGGVSGDAVASFDGTDDRVAVPALGITNGPFSLEVWGYLTATSGWHTLMGYDNTHRLLWSGTDGSLLAQFDGNFYATVKPSANAWHHIVYTFDGTMERFYVDGQPAGTHATTKPTWPAAFSIGAYDQSNYFFKGSLDEVAVYGTALSPSRIQAHYAARSLSGSADIGGATGPAYTPVGGDLGYGFQLAVTATNGSGHATTTSNTTTPVTPGPAPKNASLPAIPRSIQVGVQLTTSPGIWSGTTPMTFSYQWQRGNGYPVAVIPDNPIAYWRLDETDSRQPALDSSGNGHSGKYAANGVAFGTTGGVSGDTAVGLDGTSGRVDLPALGITSGPFTLEAWGYLKATSGWHTLMGYDMTHRLLWSGTDGSLLAQFDGNFYATVKPSRNAWHQIVYTFDGTTERFYVDGQPAGSHATLKPTWSSAFSIGAYDPSNYLFVGYLDEIGIYKSALSPSRIQAHYAARNLTGWADIQGATAKSYKPVAGDLGFTLSAKVTAANSAGHATSTSNQTAPVTS